MMGNRLLLIQTAWWTAEGTSNDDESNDGGEHRVYEPQTVN